MVSTMTYRLSSRRFLQELFLDLNFDELIHDSVEILKEKTFDDQTKQVEKVREVPTKTNSRTNGDLAQRCAELSDVVRNPNTVIFASDTNRNVTRGFSVENIRSRGTDTVDGRATSPLSSVVEEDSTMINCVNTDLTKKQTLPLTKINRNTLDSLRLTCSENKFPITNRAAGQGITRTYSYGSRAMRAPLTKQSFINQSSTETTVANQNTALSPPVLANSVPTTKMSET